MVKRVFVTAPVNNFDRVFDDTVKAYREMGGDARVAEAQEIYKKQQAK